MISWKEFASREPSLAKVGEALIFQFGVGLAFLATVRKDGAPRVHPVCPVLSEGRLYVLIQPESPKRYDLLRDGRFALQSFPPPREESEEFYISGATRMVEEDGIRKQVFTDAKHKASEDEIFFELLIDRAMHTTWENWGTSELRPVHHIWREVL
ncbi:MAG: pyridoxamine 5'-phosphate oxidase [Anaerolineales bacterium]|nr:pyridoxamine 5'-phosphate oxidase [Anaerolineales bacterium]